MSPRLVSIGVFLIAIGVFVMFLSGDYYYVNQSGSLVSNGSPYPIASVTFKSLGGLYLEIVGAVTLAIGLALTTYGALKKTLKVNV